MTLTCSSYANDAGVIPRGHVGEKDFVAFFKAVQDFDRVYRGAPEPHSRSHSLFVVGHKFED